MLGVRGSGFRRPASDSGCAPKPCVFNDDPERQSRSKGNGFESSLRARGFGFVLEFRGFEFRVSGLNLQRPPPQSDRGARMTLSRPRLPTGGLTGCPVPPREGSTTEASLNGCDFGV